jgi:hypothetical protein
MISQGQALMGEYWEMTDQDQGKLAKVGKSLPNLRHAFTNIGQSLPNVRQLLPQERK